jgi:type IV pilus assembly protein PilE
MRRQTGFTLLELMIAVAVVGILAAVAYPSYTDHIRRGKLAEAMSILADTRTKMEQFYLDNRTYVGADAANMPCNATVINASARHFTFACSNLGAGTYTVTATGATTQNMAGFTYAVDQANVRSTTISGVSGWTGSTTCWVRAKGGVC